MSPPLLSSPSAKGWICRVVYKLSLSEGPCVFNDKLDLDLAEVLSQCLMEYSIVGEGAPSYLCARYSVAAGGFLPAAIAMENTTNWFRRVMRPQAPA